MNRTRRAALALTLVLAGPLAAQPPVAALDIDITDADVRRAVDIATGTDAARDRFHASYIVPVTDPLIERLEVITELRRFVLAFEEQHALGNWMLARGGFDSKGRTLRDLLTPWRGQVAVRARLRFHPHHSYPGVPDVEILVGEPSYLPIEVTRTPLMIPGRKPDEAASLTGAVIETTFNAPSFHDRALLVRVMLDGKELAGASVDFSKLD